MPHYHHNPFPGRVQLYDVGETVVERQLEMLDELLNDAEVNGVIRRSAQQAKDSLSVLRSHTIEPNRIASPRRETVERAKPSIDVISREVIHDIVSS